MGREHVKVILDANAFYDDPNLTEPQARLLTDYVGKGSGLLVVPAVVFDEVVNTFSERLRKLITEAVGSVKKLERLTERAHIAPEPALNIDAEEKAYERRLRSKLLQLNATVLPYPKISHEQLALRDRKRRKPFSKGGRGYRDALIWQSILEHLAGSKGAYLLVTANYKDFCERDDDHRQLHDHLQRDLAEAAFTGSLIVRPKIQDVVEEFVKPALDRFDEIDDIKDKLQRSAYAPLNLRELLVSELDAILEGINRCLELEFRGIDIDEPFGVSGLYDPGEIQVVDVIELEGGDLYVELNVEYEADIYAYVFKSDAYGLNDDSPVQVSDWNWNESYAEVSGTPTLEVSIQLTFDPKNPDEVNLEVTSAHNESDEEY